MNSPFDEAKYQALLEGLEVTEILLSEANATPDFRVDAEFHKKAPEDNPLYQYTPIGGILESSQYGISIEMNEEGRGVPIYRMNEITDMLCDADILKCANVSDLEAMPFLLKDRDVLFNRTNSQAWVGRTGIYKAFSDEKRIFASYLVRFIPNYEHVLPEYLTAFLNSSFGVWDIKRRARVSINQSNVNPEEVKEIRIPLLSIGFQEKLVANFNSAHHEIESSDSLYAQAEMLLLNALNLNDWQPTITSNYTVRSSIVWDAGRFDADYFHPKFAAMLDHVNIHAKRCRILSEFATFCDRGTQPIYDDDGTLAVVNSKHILEKGLDYDNFERANATLWNHRDFIKARIQRGDILTYTTGANIGRTGVYLEDAPALASNHVNLTRIEGENAIYVGVVLNSRIGRMQTRRDCTGSAQVEIYPSDICQFVVPFVAPDIEAEIVRCVEASHHAKRRAKTLLDLAKRAVEMAIEYDEAAALAILGDA